MKMKRSFAPRNPITTREKPPLFSKDKNGNALLLCPFCEPPHPINTESAETCGTILQVRAMQTIYKAKRNDPKAVCIKCRKGGGEMTLFQGALIHIHDCTPGTVAFSTPPKYSRFAKFTNSLKDGWLKTAIQKRFGKVVSVEEVTPEGERTGHIFGFFFEKKRGKNVTNRERERTAPGA